MSMNRRDAVLALGAFAGLPLLRAGASPQASATSPARRRAIRLAHLTDVHVQPERRANEGMVACLRHVQSLKDKPELILTGGDCIMDSFESDDARTAVQWGLWRSILKSECSLPVMSAIGNHDIWGWNKARSRTTGDEPNHGKKRAMEMLGLAQPHHSFDRAGWHFVVLDSVQPHQDGYLAYLDEAQFDWLRRDLQATPAHVPVLVLSHIPICSVTPMQIAREQDGALRVSSSLVHRDARRLQALFAQHPNVKVCLSGHTHLVDRVDYDGVTYLCDGAVCGNWWKGRHHQCEEGYAVIDLFDDGSVERQYVEYGWAAGL